MQKKLRSITPARLDQMQEIMQLSADLLNLAGSSAWDKLSDTYHTRQVLLEAFFTTEPLAQEAEWIRESIEQVLATDEKIREQVEAGKLKMAAELKSGSKGRQVIAAYAENTK